MSISDRLIYKLQAIIKDQHDRDLSFAETAKIGNDLVELFDVIAKIDYLEKTAKDDC